MSVIYIALAVLAAALAAWYYAVTVGIGGSIVTEDTRNFWCFMGTLAAIVALSKIGGTGADLAIMTGLIGVLGMLARPARDKKDEVQTEEKPQ